MPDDIRTKRAIGDFSRHDNHPSDSLEALCLREGAIANGTGEAVQPRRLTTLLQSPYSPPQQKAACEVHVLGVVNNAKSEVQVCCPS